MKKVLDQITAAVSEAFARAGFDPKLGKCTVSNRPDLCQYQCNGAMAGAKLYHKAPFMIAQQVVDVLASNEMFSKVEMVRPGFINLDLNPDFLGKLLNELEQDPDCGVEKAEHPLSIVVDYGGPNVAKPLHVGHLRPAIIGEAVKRIARFMGHNVIGDPHLGDWGLQIGLIIVELKRRQPDLPYFDANITDGYPEEPPFTITDLEEIYPFASKVSKEDAAYKEEARQATYELQQGRPGYRALWKHILNVSVNDLKENYKKLDVDFAACSAHKLYAPMGMGALYARAELLDKMPPFLSGGDMIGAVHEHSATWAEGPRKFEAGTRNVGGEVGFAAALDYMDAIGWDAMMAHEHTLLDRMLKGMAQMPWLTVYGDPTAANRFGVVSFNVNDVHPHDVATILDAGGVAVRAGHHCAQPLMDFLGIGSCCRASVAVYNTEADVDALLENLENVRKVMGL